MNTQEMKQWIAKWMRLVLRRTDIAPQGKPPSTFMRAYYVSRQVVLVTARHRGVNNVWPMDWRIPLSEEPPLYSIAVTSTSFGVDLIRGSGIFVVNFAPRTWEAAILHCGQVSGREEDKFEATCRGSII